MRINTSESLSLGFKNLKKLLGMVTVLLLVMSGFRLLYLFLYGGKNHWTAELWTAFGLGFRFDLSVLCYISVLPALALSFAFACNSETLHLRVTKWMSAWFQVMGFLLLLILSADMGYYTYFQDHLNILVFGFFEDDTMALLRTFWKNYPLVWIFVLTLVALILWRWLVRKIFRPIEFRQRFEYVSKLWKIPVILSLLVAVTLGARGSLGLFPLGEADTVISADPFINLLPTNGVHTLVRAIKLKTGQKADWNYNLKTYGYSSPQQAFADFYQVPIEQIPLNPTVLFEKTLPTNSWAEKTKPHVVIFMMESFGSYWMQFHSGDFNLLGDLESHLASDYLFKNFVPATGSTIGSISSLMINAPQRPAGAFLTESQFLQVRFPTSPARVYKQAGYKTRFVYGGAAGWRDLNKFALYQGFDTVEGDADMDRKLGGLKERHDWGVYDEDVFRYVMMTLKEAEQPQLVVVLTTTNHPPYQIPTTFKAPPQKIPESIDKGLVVDRSLAQDRFRVYHYASDQLGKFMTELKSTPELKDKTLIAATGDHNFYVVNFSEAQLLQKWAVPLYLYLPEELKKQVGPVDLTRFGSHMDIFPTLARLSLSNVQMKSLGNNLLDPQTPPGHLAAYHSTGLAINSEGAVINFGVGRRSYFLWNDDKTQLEPTSETPGLAYLGVRYQSLMSLLDFYFFEEQKSQRSNENTHR